MSKKYKNSKLHNDENNSNNRERKSSKWSGKLLTLLLCFFSSSFLHVVGSGVGGGPQNSSPAHHHHEKNEMLLVATLDGRISALDPNNGGKLMWDISSGATMLSSTISQIELTNNAKWVKLIPSLGGGLYKFDGEAIEPVPLSAETLLRSSFKFADNTVITGGKESKTLGIDLRNGNMKYECTMENGCTHNDEENKKGDDDDSVLIIQRQTQTVRAIEPRTGSEKWNFSVSQHDLTFHPGTKTTSLDSEDYDEETIIQDETREKFEFKAVVSDGIICSVNKNIPEDINWKFKFESPIVHAWRFFKGKLVKVNLFSSTHIPQRLSVLDDEIDGGIQTPLMYIGTHKKQLYIQESDALHSEANKAAKNYFLNPDGDSEFPRVTWRPYLITADSRTPIINHGAKNNFPLLTHLDPKSAENTAIAIFSGSDYPFDSGLYLYPEEPNLDYDPILDNKTLNSDNKKDGKYDVGDYDFEWNDDDDETLEDGPSQPIQFVFIGLSYWWKEVVLISFATVCMFNVMIIRPYINYLRNHFNLRINQMKNKPEVVESYVVVQVPVQVPSTPDTNGSGSTGTGSTTGGEFQFSKDNPNNRQFISRFESDFDLVRCLGKGGFGVVFECRNKIDDIHYAVKRIRLPINREAKRKVIREVKSLAKLDHKNIVRYFHTWLEDPPPGWQENKDTFIKMEDFSGFMSDSNLSESRVVPSHFDPLSNGFTKDNNSTSICFDDSSGGIVFEASNNDTDETPTVSSNQSKSCDDALIWQENKKSSNSDKNKDEPKLQRTYWYIVMQLCQKETLRDWLRTNNSRSLNVILPMFHQICVGVEYVHKQSLIHRDLKPGNIFFSEDGIIKIGDFGLVTGSGLDDERSKSSLISDEKMDESGDSKPKSNVKSYKHTDQVGTELYMSPEQLGKQSYDHKVDIYSLGIILFELLVPFSTQMERLVVLNKLRKLEFPPNFEKCNVCTLVKSMLSHNPDERPETTAILNSKFLVDIELP